MCEATPNVAVSTLWRAHSSPGSYSIWEVRTSCCRSHTQLVQVALLFTSRAYKSAWCYRAWVSTTRTLVWYPESGTDVNVSMVITTPGADYTSLASFGSAQDFGANLVASMDRSFMRGKGRPAEEVRR